MYWDEYVEYVSVDLEEFIECPDWMKYDGEDDLAKDKLTSLYLCEAR